MIVNSKRYIPPECKNQNSKIFKFSFLIFNFDDQREERG